MPQFTYKAKAGPDTIKAGTIEADNKVVAVKAIRQNGLYPIFVKELSSASPPKRLRKIKSKDLTVFTRQLANLLRSGFPLSRAVATLISQTQNPGLKKLLEGLQEKINKGFTFSQGLSLYPNAFSRFYINMVKIGEAGGMVEETLERLADFQEREQDLNSQVKSALVYPALLSVVGAITIFVLISFVIPRLTVILSDLGQTLPLPTRILIQLGAFMSRFWWLFLGAAGLIIILGRYYYKMEKSRFLVDGLLLRFPWTGNLIQKLEIARFSYALGALLKNGVSMLGALGVVTLSVENRVFRKEISAFGEKIRRGGSLSSCLQKDNLFPLILTNMVALGEESGELPEMLLKVGATYEKEVNRTVKTIVSLIEPILILVMGLIVGFIVLSMLLPIFQMNISIR